MMRASGSPTPPRLTLLGSPFSSAKLFKFNHLTQTISSEFSNAIARSGPMKTDRKEKVRLSFEIAGARKSLLDGFTSLQHPYKPFLLIGSNRHVETIFASFFRSRPAVTYRRECLRMKDGGTVALDWPSGDEKRLPDDAPVLILLPGLTGGSGDTYVRHMLVRARSNGWGVVVFNSRGCADSPVTTPQETPCPLSGAVSLCNPFNLVIADEDFRKGFNIIYDRALARGLCKIFRKHAALFEGMTGEYNIPLVANAKSVREFDEGLTRVSFGFKSVDDYYSNSSSSHSINHVCVPLLCIQAANDPIAPSRAIPREELRENPHCLLIVTPKGGHLGWAAGDEAPFGSPWTDPVVMEFLEHLQMEKTKIPSHGLDSVQQSTAENLHNLQV